MGIIRLSGEIWKLASDIRNDTTLRQARLNASASIFFPIVDLRLVDTDAVEKKKNLHAWVVRIF